MLQFMGSQRAGCDLATEQQQRSAWISSFLTLQSNITPTLHPHLLSRPPLQQHDMAIPPFLTHATFLFSARCCSSDSGYFYSTHTHTHRDPHTQRHTHRHTTSKVLCCSLFLFGFHHLVFRYQINSHSNGRSIPLEAPKALLYCSLKWTWVSPLLVLVTFVILLGLFVLSNSPAVIPNKI